MEKAQLVFFPLPVVGHFMSAVELAKLLLSRDQRLSVTVLIINLSNFSSKIKINSYLQSVSASNALLSDRIRFVELPKDETEGFDHVSMVQRQKPLVKKVVSKIFESGSDSSRLAGFVLDMFCTDIIDVANEFGVPSYVYFASSAAFLGFMLHVQVIHDEKQVDDLTELMESGGELAVPSLVNAFPAKALPTCAFKHDKWFSPLLHNFRRFKEVKGIMVNTFFELESYAIESWNSNGRTPPLYPVGPILNLESDEGNKKHQDIIQWLDNQPPSSVVFLCFGSRGSFSADQVKEIAYALEHCGYRFLWSLRRQLPHNNIKLPSEYEDPQEDLPEGFVNRTSEIGKIVGWAPQTVILAHPAIRGFVSHCGWNSTLESIWYGVPIATWPIYAELQFNAFDMVTELGLAVEIKMDYRDEDDIIVNRDEIERGIRCLMDQDNGKRKKVKEMSEKSRVAMKKGGSSFIFLGSIIEDVMNMDYDA